MSVLCSEDKSREAIACLEVFNFRKCLFAHGVCGRSVLFAHGVCGCNGLFAHGPDYLLSCNYMILCKPAAAAATSAEQILSS